MAAKTYAFSDPLNKPVNLTETLVIGGSLTVSTTYYYRLVASNHTEGYATSRGSPLSDERSFTTTAQSITTPVFTGSGLNDLTKGGSYSLTTTDTSYVVEIDSSGTPDTFKWSDDGGVTWDATGVAITGSAQTLNNGVTITFGATTGHTVGDRWTF